MHPDNLPLSMRIQSDLYNHWRPDTINLSRPVYCDGVEASILRPKAAAATSDYRATFAASYRISQKTLADAHGSPT